MHKSPNVAWRIFSAGAHSAKRGQNFPAHSHTHWEWVYYRSGFIECLHGDELLPMQPGSLWLTPPGVTHAEIAKTAYANFYFGVEGAPDVLPPRVVQDDAEGSLGKLLEMIVREISGRSDGSPDVLSALTLTLTLMMTRLAGSTQTRPQEKLAAGAEMLWGENPRLSIAESASRLGVSISGLRDAFHRQRQCSPVARRREIRNERAVRLLQTSTHKLEAIAELCGFDSASHLSRSIKAATGKSPGSVRTLGIKLLERPPRAS